MLTGFSFDSVTGAYAEVPEFPFGSPNGGRSHLGCGIIPADGAVICGGGSNSNGERTE